MVKFSLWAYHWKEIEIQLGILKFSNKLALETYVPKKDNFMKIIGLMDYYWDNKNQISFIKKMVP